MGKLVKSECHTKINFFPARIGLPGWKLAPMGLLTHFGGPQWGPFGIPFITLKWFKCTIVDGKIDQK